MTIEEGDLALVNFFNFSPDLKNEVSLKIHQNWKDYDDAVGALDGIDVFQSVDERPKWMEDSLQNLLWLKKLTAPEKVWEYLQAIEIVITKDRWKKKKGVYIQIICDCAWEEEHGLQIILKDGKDLIRVSGIDGCLFD